MWLGRFTEGKNCIQVRMCDLTEPLSIEATSPDFHWELPLVCAVMGWERDKREALGGIWRGGGCPLNCRTQPVNVSWFLLSLSYFSKKLSF